MDFMVSSICIEYVRYKPTPLQQEMYNLYNHLQGISVKLFLLLPSHDLVRK